MIMSLVIIQQITKHAKTLVDDYYRILNNKLREKRTKLERQSTDKVLNTARYRELILKDYNSVDLIHDDNEISHREYTNKKRHEKYKQ